MSAKKHLQDCCVACTCLDRTSQFIATDFVELYSDNANAARPLTKQKLPSDSRALPVSRVKHRRAKHAIIRRASPWTNVLSESEYTTSTASVGSCLLSPTHYERGSGLVSDASLITLAHRAMTQSRCGAVDAGSEAVEQCIEYETWPRQSW